MEKDFIKKVFEWDVINWSQSLKLWERKLNESGKGGKALELGGRRGGMSLWLADKGFHVLCTDLENPEKDASPLHQSGGVAHLITYDAMDATDIPYENHFDVIIFKSILGGVGRNDRADLQQKTIDQVHKALKKGGIFLFAENLTGSPFHRFFRKTFIRWARYWRYVRKSEMEQYLSGFSAYEMDTTGFAGTFGRSETQRNFLGKADRLFFNAVVPSTWNYICYGWAQK